MKTKLLALSQMLVLMAFSSNLHADTSVMIDEAPAAPTTVAQVVLQDNGVASSLNDSDLLTVQVASNGAVTGKNCRTINGVASIYGLNHGSGDGAHQVLAGGGRLNTGAMTAAMLTVPLHTYVEVTRGDKKIKVLVNDRGPYARGRVIDLTPAAAHGLGFSEGGSGVAKVQVKVCR
jgi:rare lipoprotein A (peptidoglycan hydrolase)